MMIEVKFKFPSCKLYKKGNNRRLLRVFILVVAIGVFCFIQTEHFNSTGMAASYQIKGGGIFYQQQRPKTILATTNPTPQHESFRDRVMNYFGHIKIMNNEHYHYDLDDLEWIQEYCLWHYEMRLQFPGSSILEEEEEEEDTPVHNASDSKPPKVLIRYLDTEINPNGLNDRLQDIHNLIRLCYDEKLVLFYVWYDAPLPLERFMVPNLFNWTLPNHPTVETAEKLKSSYPLRTKVDVSPETLNKYEVPPRIQILRMMVAGRVHKDVPYSIAWHSLFRPSQPVQILIDDAMKEHNLVSGQYDATHLRIGHPAFKNQHTREYNSQEKIRDMSTHTNKINGTIDDTIRAIESATHAISCAKWLAEEENTMPIRLLPLQSPPQATTTDPNVDNNNNNNNNNNEEKDEDGGTNNTKRVLPLYFFADSRELTELVVDWNRSGRRNGTFANLPPPPPHKNNNNYNDNTNDATMRRDEAFNRLAEITRNYPNRIEGRTKSPTAHLATTDLKYDAKSYDEKDSSFRALASTFVDLFIASQARCISIGVGKFGYMAGQIAGLPHCWRRHTHTNLRVSNGWGMGFIIHRVPICPEPWIAH